MEIQELLREIHNSPDVRVIPFNQARTFHDRTLEFTVIDKEGCTVTHHYDLTGGVDLLLNRDAETKIYWYQHSE